MGPETGMGDHSGMTYKSELYGTSLMVKKSNVLNASGAPFSNHTFCIDLLLVITEVVNLYFEKLISYGRKISSNSDRIRMRVQGPEFKLNSEPNALYNVLIGKQ